MAGGTDQSLAMQTEMSSQVLRSWWTSGLSHSPSLVAKPMRPASKQPLACNPGEGHIGATWTLKGDRRAGPANINMKKALQMVSEQRLVTIKSDELWRQWRSGQCCCLTTRRSLVPTLVSKDTRSWGQGGPALG